ncbi:hypothetical protein KGQ34_03180 [Patescibacteria group bacterium]|nr:hypothetical protein [Patescibacteria group bacterium]
MIEIVPAINVSDFETVQKRIRQVENYVRWVHIDVADGTFTPNSIWHNSLDLVGFQTPTRLEIHLMIDHAEEHFETWFLPAVRRIIFHIETLRDPEFVIDACHKARIQVGFAVAPHTSWTALKPYIGKVELLQVLAVRPGLAGQEFEGHNYSKIKHLRALCPDCRIEVDGGVKVGVAKRCVEMGADYLAAASAIFGERDPLAGIEKLKRNVAFKM